MKKILYFGLALLVQTARGEENMDIATFGGGCFWCVEAVYERIPGVQSVISGYEGGTIPNPTYRDVTSGRSGHAEVVQVTFDPAVVSYAELVELFWQAHDPTQLNRQGADVGTQYRSVIFYHNEEQKQIAEASRDRLQAAGAYRKPIVTQIVPTETFYPAEEYHQDYYLNNPAASYSVFVIRPKLKKLNLKQP
jgi:peptide-methionine (S)-S-oxide reductase